MYVEFDAPSAQVKHHPAPAALQQPSAATSSTYEVRFTRPTGGLVSEVSAANANRPSATASLSDDPAISQDAFFLVGTVTTNLPAGRASLLPLAQVPGLSLVVLRNVTSNTALTGTFLGPQRRA